MFLTRQLYWTVSLLWLSLIHHYQQACALVCFFPSVCCFFVRVRECIALRLSPVWPHSHYSRSPICYTTLRPVYTQTHIHTLGSLVSLQELPSSQWRAVKKGITSLFCGFLSHLTSFCCLSRAFQLLHSLIVQHHCCVLKRWPQERRQRSPTSGSTAHLRGSAWIFHNAAVILRDKDLALL